LKVPEAKKSTVDVTIGQKIRSELGKTEFKLMHVVKDEHGALTAFPVKGTSGTITGLERADGYCVIDRGTEFLNTGDKAVLHLFRDRELISEVVFVGSHDYVLDMLFGEYRKKYPNRLVKKFFTGSTGGLSAIAKKECDITGIHLLDPKTKQYNRPYLERYAIGNSVAFVPGYKRIQGIYTAKDNPKGIRGLRDFLRPETRMINRSEGSGTRILFDSLINDLAMQVGLTSQEICSSISGYRTSALSHTACATAVAEGAADVAIGIEQYSKIYDLGFIPLAEEEYDLLVAKSSINKPEVADFLLLFNSSEFRSNVISKFPNTRWC
ncbi:MAG TPA: substrate-binding domain-containing protein, partial [Candidatus Hodarchaeales archaeon]|nr:substrate-binding domain-containing protein [Candidatus Hodarchaeales archaeon]